MMDGYQPQLDKLHDLYFVTLTTISPQTAGLKARLVRMYKEWRTVTNRARKTREGFIGLRKLECNPRPNDFVHPHFHVVVQGKDNAYWLMNQWLERWGNLADRSGQDVRKADSDSLKEIFKYMTKPAIKLEEKDGVIKASKRGYKLTDEEIDQLDAINCALRRKRIVQPFGGLTKVSEEIRDEDLTATITAPDTLDHTFAWDKSIANYVGTLTGHLLIEYTKPPPKRLLRFLASLKEPPEALSERNGKSVPRYAIDPLEKVARCY
jgi:hypothetical protein